MPPSPSGTGGGVAAGVAYTLSSAGEEVPIMSSPPNSGWTSAPVSLTGVGGTLVGGVSLSGILNLWVFPHPFLTFEHELYYWLRRTCAKLNFIKG